MQEYYNMGHAVNMEGSLNSEVVIIGGGLSGLTAAYYLLVLEKQYHRLNNHQAKLEVVQELQYLSGVLL
jgi:protoporphyrinogen oxidase